MGWLKREVWVVVYLAVLTAGAYLIADLANLLIGRQLEASVRVEEARPGPPAPPPSVNPEAYRRIIEGNLFNAALRGAVSAPIIDAPLSASPLDLQVSLIGTGESEGGPSFAVIEDRATREQAVYRVNDLVKNGAVLAKVERNQVTLLLGTQRQVVTMYDDGTEDVTAPGAPAASPASGEGPGSGIQQVQSNRWVLDKQEVAGALDNLPQLLTKARVIPNFSNGKPDGFKIFAIAPDSLYAKIGLQNGDVLQQINGVEIKDPENFMRVFQQLKDETNIALDFVRNNQRQSFSYEIR